MILMISPGMFWLSAQQAPPRRKLCPDKLPSPWVTAFSFLSNTAPDMGKAGVFGDCWTAARSAWQTADTGHRGEGGGLVVSPCHPAVPLTLSIPFNVEEMNQLSFNGLLKPASRCMTLTMFKYCRTDAGRSRLAKQAAYIAIVFSFAGTGGTHSSVQKRRKEFLWDV